MCEALKPGPYSASTNMRHKVAGQAPKEKLEWKLLLLRISRKIRVSEASIAVNQARKFTMDAKRESSMASSVVASQPRKTTIKKLRLRRVKPANELHSFALILACIV